MNKDLKEIPLNTALWMIVYEELIKHGVKFPEGYDGVSAAYAGLCAIDDVLKEYKITNSND